MIYETTQGVARRLGVDESTVRRACQAGKLPAIKGQRNWYVSPLDAEPWPYLCVEEVSRALGISKDAVWALCRRGALCGTTRGPGQVWHIPREAVAEAISGGEAEPWATRETA